MSTNVNILFIDDEVGTNQDGRVTRNDVLECIKENKNINITATHPNDFNKNIISEGDYDLIIVDYCLDKKSNSDNIFYDGSGRSILSPIRDINARIPVYLVSTIIPNDKMRSEVFEKVVTHKLLTTKKGRDMLLEDCYSFRQLSKINEDNNDINDIYSLLMAPSSSRDALKLAIPSEFQSGIKSNNSILSKIDQPKILKFSHWVNYKLLVNNGPLCSDLEAAQIIGITLEHFQNTFINSKNLISECKYSGIFSKSSNNRWWRQSLYDWISDYLSNKNYKGQLPWKVLPSLLEINCNDISKCVVCELDKPDCIAYDSELEDDDLVLHMAHWSCCKIDDNRHPEFGFNELYCYDS